MSVEGQHVIDTRALEVAVAAKIAGEAHEKVCTQRQSDIIKAFETQTASREALRLEINASFGKIYTIMWKGMYALVAFLVMCLLYMITQNGLPGVHSGKAEPLILDGTHE